MREKSVDPDQEMCDCVFTTFYASCSYIHKIIIMKYIQSVLIILLLAGCEMTTSRSVPPEYTDAARVEATLREFVADAEEISIDGRSITKNGRNKRQLEVSFTNSKSIPKEADKREALARAIAQSVKQHLKNKNAYQTIDIQFVSTKGDLLSSQTETIETIFENKDLE